MFENIPKNWKKLEAEKYCFAVTDGTHDSPKQVEYNGIYLLTSKNITSGKLDYKNAYSISKKDFEKINKRSLVEKYDILFSMIGTVGESCIVDTDYINFAIKNVGLFKLNGDKVKAKWLNYFFKTADANLYIKQNLKGGNQKYIALNILRKFPVPIPPTLEEQQEIVDVLDAASEIIRLRTACIESAQSLIPALFQEMFGDMNKNNNTYELFKIKDLGKVTTGSTPSSKKENMFGGDIPFITPADLESGQDKYGRYVTSEGAQNSRIVRAGSTLVCCIGATIGKVDRAIVDSCFNQQINAIEWNEDMNDIFGLYLFRQIAPLIRNKASHTTLPILNKGNFENIIIPKPPIEQQELFAAKAQEIEAYIKAQQAELDNAKTMFQSLLHHSFTGELTRRAYDE